MTLWLDVTINVLTVECQMHFIQGLKAESNVLYILYMGHFIFSVQIPNMNDQYHG